MKFAIAIGILAQGLVLAKEPTHAELVQEQTQLSTPSRNNVMSKVKQHRALMNKHPLAQARSEMHQLKNRKCVPNVETGLASDADTGILENQCLPGEACSELGYCEAVAPGVSLRQNYGDDNLNFDDDIFANVNYYAFLCTEQELEDTYFGDDSINYVEYCDCARVDVANQTGIIECTVPSDSCDADYCYELSFTFEFEGSFTQYTYSNFCLRFSEPYEQDLCYSYEYGVDECQISVDEELCNSCLQITEEGHNSYGCVQFDCTNIASGNEGSDCDGDSPTNISTNSTTVYYPVDENVAFLQSILYGISSMSISEQQEWATLTAEYIVSYHMTENPDIQDITVLIEVLAVMPNDRRGRILQDDGSVTIVYNTFVSYSIEDPNSITPLEFAEVPFLTEADQANYVQFLMDFGTGDIANINGVDPLGQQSPIRPGKGGKKSKKSSKKSSKSSKSSKSDKKGSGKGSQIYDPPPVQDLEDDDYYHYKESKKGKGITSHMYGYPENNDDSSRSSKSDKKGKSRRH
jgi:hypothetical protein